MKRILYATVTSIVLCTHVACGDVEFASRSWSKGLIGGDAELNDEDGVPIDNSNDGSEGDLVVESEGQPECIDRDVASVIDFESFPGVAGSPANMFVTDEYAPSHGVIFRSSGNHQAVIRRTARAGEDQIPASEEAWMCILCSGTPSRNRLQDAAAEQRVGRHVLSSTAAAEHEAASLTVEYVKPVARFSFDLIDVDGNEAWEIVPFDAAGNPIASLTQTVSFKGYATGKTGNGLPTRVEVETPSGKAEIHGFTISGDKSSLLRFGFAMDNFDTGVPTCEE